MIAVTEPFLPPIEEYVEFLNGIWERNWLTNNGPLVNDLELNLKRLLNVKHLLYVANGTIAIQLALKALHVNKKVITTPFSYVATTSSLVWEGCTPVFADIDPHTFNINPLKIEELIDEETEAILATHCFGNPCDIEAIDIIAKKHGLKVIYDAAHCFGTEYKGASVLAYGDVSATSFHATKLYHTIEGGAVSTNNPDLIKTMDLMHNFGHDGPERFTGMGINGKNSEFHAAMGIINLKYVDEILIKRKKLCAQYDDMLMGLVVDKQLITSNSKYNYAYYPLVFTDENTTLKMKAALEKKDIFPRRYFYPSLSNLNYVKGNKTPISDSIASRILCLPLYHRLNRVDQELVSSILLKTQNS